MSENTASGLRVAVLGAHGRMGSEAVKAVEAAEGLDLVAAIDHSDSLQGLVDAQAEVLIDLTVPAASEDNVRFGVEHGIHCVVGTTGWDDEKLARLEQLLGERPEVGVLIAPNFSIAQCWPCASRLRRLGSSNRQRSWSCITRTRSTPPRAPPPGRPR